MKNLPRPTWHSPGHRLWDDFCRAMVPAQLMEVDWIRYQEAHDTEESAETLAEIDRIRDLLEKPIGPLPGPLKEPKVRRPVRMPRPKRA